MVGPSLWATSESPWDITTCRAFAHSTSDFLTINFDFVHINYIRKKIHSHSWLPSDSVWVWPHMRALGSGGNHRARPGTGAEAATDGFENGPHTPLVSGLAIIAQSRGFNRLIPTLTVTPNAFIRSRPTLCVGKFSLLGVPVWRPVSDSSVHRHLHEIQMTAVF